MAGSKWISRRFLKDDVIGADQIADDSVDTAQLADKAVETAKIDDGAVGTTQIAAGALSADAAGRAKMATDYFNGPTVSDKFANASISIAQLQNGIVATEATNIPGGDGAGNVGDLNSTPVQVIGDPGAGFAIIPLQFIVEFTGTTAYDGAAAGDDLVFRYIGGAAAELTPDIDNGNGSAIRLVRAAPGTDHSFVYAGEGAEIIPQDNTGVELFVRNNDPFAAAGDISMKVFAVYRVVPIPLP